MICATMCAISCILVVYNDFMKIVLEKIIWNDHYDMVLYVKEYL